ncbi:hypothetical protein AB1Y20_019599 [Prymnesium parvum]|uniref:Uncharacterized protein n=1 Tax=Prymnesium parvum TaxID=97485 RepID=A0AB34JS80_PRYPA
MAAKRRARASAAARAPQLEAPRRAAQAPISKQQGKAAYVREPAISSRCTPVYLRRTRGVVYLRLSAINLKLMELQRHHELMEERRRAIHELELQVERTPRDVEARSKLIALLSAEPPPVPQV